MIDHALRFTAPETRRAYVYPARHYASSSTSASLPPMGLRVRLKASVDISKFPPQARVVLKALQVYGMILADNGSPWYVSGAPNPHWSNDDLHSLGRLTGADFEVVDTSSLPSPASSRLPKRARGRRSTEDLPAGRSLKRGHGNRVHFTNQCHGSMLESTWATQPSPETVVSGMSPGRNGARTWQTG